jgi:hypothetical protein
MSGVFPEGSAKAGAASKGGGPNQYTGTWGWACDRENLDRVAAATFFGIPKGKGSLWVLQTSWWGGAISAVVGPTGI